MIPTLYYKLFPHFLLLTLLSCSYVEEPRGIVEILWDHREVPHIYCGSHEEAYYALGWTQGSNHLELVIQNFAASRKWHTNASIRNDAPDPDTSEQYYGQLRAFVTGINASAEVQQELEEVASSSILPLSVQDVLIHFLWLFHHQLQGKHFSRAEIFSSSAGAIDKKLSSTGHSILFGSLKLPVGDEWRFTEAHWSMNSDESYVVHLLGLPFFWVGFNEDVAWSTTFNPVKNMEAPSPMQAYQVLRQFSLLSGSTSFQAIEATFKSSPPFGLNLTCIDRRGNICYLSGGADPVENSPIEEGSYKRFSGSSDWIFNGAKGPGDLAKAKRFDFADQFVIKQLLERQEWSIESVIRLQRSTTSETANRLLDDLLALKPILQDSLKIEALKILENWDRRMEPQSEGAVLFVTWLRAITRGDLRSDQPYLVPWNAEKPVTTPDGILSPEFALECLSSAAFDVKTKYDSLSVPWGTVYRFRKGAGTIPSIGGMNGLGTVDQVDYEPCEDNRFCAISAGALVWAVEMGRSQRAFVSTRTYRMANAFAPKQMPILVKRSVVERHLVKRETIFQNKVSKQFQYQ